MKLLISPLPHFHFFFSSSLPFTPIHRSLERDIQSHKKEIREREETISDKEKRILDLKKKNQELEKFRFVLDYKIKELKLHIAPREAEIYTMRKQISEMDLELEQYHKSNGALNLMIVELKLRLDGLRKEWAHQEQRYGVSMAVLYNVNRDIIAVGEEKNNSALKAMIVALYRTYVQNEDNQNAKDNQGRGGNSDSNPTSGEENPLEVQNRDRELMEKNFEGLKRGLKTCTLAYKRDVGEMTRENVMLTSELNTLRKDSRSMQLQKRAIDAAHKEGLHLKPNLIEVMDVLHMKIPKSLLDGKAPGGANGKGTEAARATEKEPIPPPPSSRQSGGTARSTALLTTQAEGPALDPTLITTKLAGKTPRKHSSANSNSPFKGDDHWVVWKELEIQNDQLAKLEDSLRTLCVSLNIDPNAMLESIDASL